MLKVAKGYFWDISSWRAHFVKQYNQPVIAHGDIQPTTLEIYGCSGLHC